MQRIAIFASGSGTNMQRIAEYFTNNPSVEVTLVVCNKPGAGVVQRADNLHIPIVMIDRFNFYESDFLSQKLLEKEIDSKNIFFYTCDILKSPEELVEILETYTNWIRKLNNNRIYIFLDEISTLKNWQKSLKFFIDTNNFPMFFKQKTAYEITV